MKNIVIEQINEYIESKQLPEELKNVIQELFVDYQYASKKYLGNVELAIGNNGRLIEELNNIASSAKRESENGKDKSIELSNEVFREKVDKLKEKIPELLNVEEKEDTVLNPILHTNENTQARNSMKMDQENREYSAQIKENIISQIESAKEKLIEQVNENVGRSEYLIYSQKVFINEVGLILNKAKVQLPTVTKGELDGLDNQINEKISQVKNEELQSGEKVESSEQRKNFVSELKFEVKEKKAVDKVIESQQNKEDLSKELPDNVIE